ncbi:MAG: cytidylyltransferase domain-containing protein [Minwuia sp.]|uniref:cytidylyltransferase domain-containing protein n=1 Tax=Minwuia sp. TaxID=2493630 RepID=UPI003A88A6BB
MHDLIPIIVQARTGSSRCPAKVMRTVAGRRLIDYTLDALELCRAGRPLIVATSDDPLDDALAAHCAARSTPVVRGPLLDVAGRFRTVLQQFPVRAFVRVSGDSPLIDHRLVDLAVETFRTERPDIVSNVVERTYPKGQSVEVLASHAFLKGEAEMADPADREHVTTWFYRHAERFNIVSLKADENLGQASMVIDTEEEFRRFRKLAHQLDSPAWRYRWHELAPRIAEAG